MLVRFDCRINKIIQIIFIVVLCAVGNFAHAEAAEDLFAKNNWTIIKKEKFPDHMKFTAANDEYFNGKKYVKVGNATIKPTIGNIAKGIYRFGNGIAVAKAIADILGAGVDYVMDPENNRIRYYDDNAAIQCDQTNRCSYASVLYQCIGGYCTGIGVNYYDSASSALSDALSKYTKAKQYQSYTVIDEQNKYYVRFVNAKNSNDIDAAIYSKVQNRYYDPNAEAPPKQVEKYKTFDEIAKQIQSNALAGHAASQDFIFDVANTAFSNDPLVDPKPALNQLEASPRRPAEDYDENYNPRPDAKKENEAKGESTKTDPETGKTEKTDLKLEFPVFCTWATTVCEAAQVVINAPSKLEQKYQELSQAFKDYFKDEPIQKDPPEKPEQDDDAEEMIGKMQSVQFDSSAYCPPDVSIPVNFNGLGSSNLTFSYEPLCIVAQKIRPIVILLAWIIAAYIVSGRNMAE